MKSGSLVKKLMQALLATTCLCVAPASSQVVNEPPDFGNVAGSPTVLPAGTIQVNGSLCTFSNCTLDLEDWFAIPGLTTGDSISIMESSSGNPINYYVEDSSNGVITSGTLNGLDPVNFVVTAPTDGELIFGERLANEGQGLAGYTVSIADTSTPEPGTVETSMLALAAAVALRRKLIP